MTTIVTNTLVAMTAVTVPVPASSDGAYPAEHSLAGVGIFIATLRDRRWRFTRHAKVVPAGTSEHVLLEGIADRLPGDSMLIGWDVDHALVPALLEASAAAPPTVSHYFLMRLHRLLRGGVVDLSLIHGGAGAPSLATIAADTAIYAPLRDADAIFSAWATGLVDQLRLDLAEEATALWRVFIRSSGLPGLGAEAATDAWIARLQRLKAMKRSRSARRAASNDNRAS